MICPNCRFECEEGLMFCSKCGTKLIFDDSQELVPSNQPEGTFENIVGGISSDIYDEDDEIESRINRDLKVNGSIVNTNYISEEESEKVMNEGSSDSYKSKKTNNTYNSKNRNKKKTTGKTIILVAVIAIVAVAASVFGTIMVKKSIMTTKFDKYYNQGSKEYAENNLKEAKTQFINAANNAFTDAQKIKSYEMVYKIDAILGGYDTEEIDYLEALIDIDDSNISYYEDLIVLYQNNNMEAKIDPLIASAPVSIKGDLENFDGSIPTPSYPEGNYTEPISLELKSIDGATIYYTMDGTNAFESDAKKEYSSAIKLEEEGEYTIRAFSVDKNSKSSKELVAKYVLDFGSISEPVVSVASGEYSEETKIKVTCDENCTIYYTTDGTVPTKSSTKYKKQITMPKGDSLYYFIAINDKGVASNVVTRAYNYKPTIKVDYDTALSNLTSNLISKGKLENTYGEFEDGSKAYLSYVSTTEINSETYYIIEFSKDSGGNSEYYAVSTVTGACKKATGSGESYSIKE